MTNIWIYMTIPFSHNDYSSKFDNLINVKLSHRFSVTNNAVLSEFNWKGSNLKSENKP